MIVYTYHNYQINILKTSSHAHADQQEGVLIQSTLHVKTNSGRLNLSFFMVQKSKCMHVVESYELIES